MSIRALSRHGCAAQPEGGVHGYDPAPARGGDGGPSRAGHPAGHAIEIGLIRVAWLRRGI
ncbi:hypothetical protein [Komagataeibacter saccharivorans]|uniref:hypothetical protein n=1 Tax=Komagataeibacter saccharivorans TaxID=265959 RepID=UPI0039EB8BAE